MYRTVELLSLFTIFLWYNCRFWSSDDRRNCICQTLSRCDIIVSGNKYISISLTVICLCNENQWILLNRCNYWIIVPIVRATSIRQSPLSKKFFHFWHIRPHNTKMMNWDIFQDSIEKVNENSTMKILIFLTRRWKHHAQQVHSIYVKIEMCSSLSLSKHCFHSIYESALVLELSAVNVHEK